MILDKYDNDPNVQTIVDKTRSSTLPIMRSHIEKLKANQGDQKANLDEEVQSYPTRQQEQRDSIKSESNMISNVHSSHQRTNILNSDYNTNPSITKVILSSLRIKIQ
ncbi:unnamed protein product [Rotaria sp. Silwood2]|nr:unnamed protein product [Rotaria sp. Silwood2]